MNRPYRFVALFVGTALLLGLAAFFLLTPRGGDTEEATLSLTPQTPGPSASAPAPARQAQAAGAPQGTSIVVSAQWGSQPGQLGRHRPQEANPEAPMSLVVDPAGNSVVLDQVNSRLTRYDKDGKALSPFPLTVQVAQDVAVGRNGTFAVLDRLVDKSVAVMDPLGKLKGELPVLGKNISEGGAVTGVFVDGEDVYVETEHTRVMRLGDTQGNPDLEQPQVPGRPTRDGLSFIHAGLTDSATGRIYVTSTAREPPAHRFSRELLFHTRVPQLMLLDTDRAGVIYLAMLAQMPGSAQEQPEFSVLLVCLDPLDGHPLGRTQLPANQGADETFRELTVLDEGGVVYLQRSEEGAQLTRHSCP